jgi:hypothetical protein
VDHNEQLLRLLYRALIDIRSASADGDARACGRFANLVHNIPIAMVQPGGRDILGELIERAEMLGMSSWINAAMSDFRSEDDKAG